jgi:Glycosyl hydrolases family 31
VYQGTAASGENGDDGDLGGTCRTLDEADGFARREWASHRRRRNVRLGNGLLSRRAGVVFVDDTARPVFTDDGWFEARQGSEEYVDCYALASGTEYAGALREFTKVAGRIPMVPRAYLGNWWSRYHQYTDEELRGVLLTFQELGVPLSMCIIGTSLLLRCASRLVDCCWLMLAWL